MKFKRIVSAITILSLIVTLFTGFITVTAAATYNQGTRHEICTSLSSQAEAYYTGTYSYSSLSTLSSSSLLSRLRALTTDTHRKTTSYDDCKNYAYKTDCQNGDGTVVLLYTSYVAEKGDFSGSAPGWNREHVWPKSLGGYNTSGPGADMHHIRPDDVTTNGTRGSNLFGEVTNGKQAYGSTLVNGMSGGTVGGGYFEPLDDTKGDVARICLYMYVRYGGNGSYECDDITNVFSDIDTLLAWNALDPVDTWEMGRNDVVEGIQGNRNPFIDYPELAWPLFGEDIPDDLTTPSDGVAVSYTVKAVSNNTSYGTVSISDNVITASPKSGYAVSGYNITSGSATVTQDGNVFYVEPSSDCTIVIVFAAKSKATLSFMQNGTLALKESAYVGEKIVLPQYSGTLLDGYKFIGWIGKTINETTSKPASVYPALSEYTVTADATLYALYSRSEDDGQGSDGGYSLYSGELTDGSYVIVYNDYAMLAADDDENGRIDIAEVVIDNDSISDPSASIVWNISETDDGYYTIYNEAEQVYAGGTGSKNKAALLTEVNDYAKWTGTGTETYEFVNLGNKNRNVNAILRRNGSYGFACYSGSTGGALSLYKLSTASTYYSTAMICNHANTTTTKVEPTCTESGSVTVTCLICDAVLSNTVIAATGHSYICTNAGDYHTVTCINGCNDTQNIAHNYIDGVCVCGAVQAAYVFDPNMTFNMSISVGAEMQVMYSVTASKVKNFDHFYLEVVKDVYAGESISTIFSLDNKNIESTLHPVNGSVIGYSATYTGIFASQMGDNFTATLYAVASDGTTYYGNSVTSSIQDSLYEKLATGSAELKTLAVDMLNYGAAAQIFFDYNTKNLVNADLTDAQKTLGTQGLPEATDNSSITGTGCNVATSVSLQSKVLLYINCTYTSKSNSNLKFVIKDLEGKVLDEFEPSIVNARVCQGIYDNVGASQMRDLVTIELHDNGVTVSKIVTWNIESYVAQTRATTSEQAKINAVNAMLIYGDSAAIYLEATGQ